VRTHTAIAESPASVSAAAAALARQVFGDLAGRRIVVVGAGKIGEQAARSLLARGAEISVVANRTLDRAQELAAELGAEPVGIERLPDELARADVVVASTSAPGYLLTAADVPPRRGRPLFLIDLAVPRDLDPEIHQLDDCFLYDIDDLQAVVARNLEVRASERAGAEQIVEEEIQRFARWMAQLDVVPTIAALREHGAEIVDQVLAENSGRWESASARDLARIEAVARAVMQRLLHEPTLRLKSADDIGGHGRQQLLRELFGLEETRAEADDAAPAEVRSLRPR
jgi:glutamyl-tRNA reductase